MSGGDFVLPKIGGAFVRGGFCPGGFCPGGFCPGGILSWTRRQQAPTQQFGCTVSASVPIDHNARATATRALTSAGANAAVWLHRKRACIY